MIDDWTVAVKEAFMTFSKEIYPSSSLLEVWILFFSFAFFFGSLIQGARALKWSGKINRWMNMRLLFVKVIRMTFV